MLSLAAGVMADLPVPDSVTAAAAAGWPACGVWFDHEVWTAAHEREVLRRLADSGIAVLDVEPIIVGLEPDVSERLVDAAAVLGARFILFTARVADQALVVERFGHACDLAAAADPRLTIVYEFLPAFPIGTLAGALGVVRDSGRSNGAVLVDNLHLARSGVTPEVLHSLDPSLLPYLQVSDAPRQAPKGSDELLHEARHARLWPGDGELPIGELLSAVPHVPLSFEVRSQRVRDTFRDPLDRAAFAWSRVHHLA